MNQALDEMQSIGNTLREAREALDASPSLEDIAQTIRINKDSLASMEEGKFANIGPTHTYTTGYLTQYAKYLNIPQDTIQEMVDHIKAHFTTESSGSNTTINGLIALHRDEHRSLIPTHTLLAASLALGVFVYTLWYQHAETRSIYHNVLQTIQEQSRKLGETIQTLSTKHLSSLSQSQDVHGQGTSAQHNDTSRIFLGRFVEGNQESTFDYDNNKIVLLAMTDTRIRIFDKKHHLVAEKNMRLGDTYFVPTIPGVIVSSDNLDLIEVFIDGQSSTFLGTLDEIASKMPTYTLSKK